MKRIPISFKLFGSTIKVTFDNKKADHINCFGCFEYSKQEITLANKDGLDDISQDRIIETFYHERTHAILNAMNKKELSEDEGFVDVFSKLLRQADETEKHIEL